MSTTGISFGGLASGLDTGAIIDALVRLERRPIEMLEDRKVTYNKKKGLYEQLRTKLEALQDAAKGLRLEGELLDFKAETDNTGFVSVSTNGRATPGTYDIKVTNLAKSEVRTSNGHADKDITGHGSGVLYFTVDGVDYDVTITGTGGDNTLDGIAAQINANDELPITATVVDTGMGSNPYRLVLSSDTSGEEGSFSVFAAPGDAALQSFAAEINDAANLQVAGENALLEFNGLPVERSSNSISDLITGVTINLIGEHGTDPASTKISVSTNTETTSEKIKKFVEAYNAVVDFAKAQNAVEQIEGGDDGPSTKASPLLGDSALRTVQSALRSIVGNSVDTGNEAIALLAQIGIESDRDGKLTFNQADFDEALAEDSDALKKLFAQSGTGIANQIYSRIDDWNDSIDGLIQARIDGIATSTRDIDKQITRLEERVEAYEQRLTVQYANLEQMMNSLNSQSAALMSLR